ncbi:MAG: YfhO family protein [Bacteroidales bacterium]
MKNFDFKKSLPYLLTIGLFLAISVIYFAPDLFEGKVLFQGDTQQGIANGQEAKEFFEQTGEKTRWSTHLFSGMPTYQMSPSYESDATLRFLTKAYSLFLPGPASLIFIMLIGFFILMKSLKVNNGLSILGAIAWAFSSYFFIIIEAGHIWKFVALAYIPPTIAGLIWTYRGSYLKGGIVYTLFMTFQILANHIQMSYYFAFLMIGLAIAYLIDAVKNKTLSAYWKATATLAVGSVLAIGMNSSNLYHTYDYSKHTIRGKSELVDENKQQTPAGLDKDYITAWSYGVDETWTLLVPNFKGGATGYMDKTATQGAKPEYRETLAQMNQYWGDQPFTSGPVYVGAFILMLAIFGFIVVKGPFKWAVLAVTLLTIILSWGKNMMFLTDLFIDYFPMYNKFRTVSSILVVAEFTIPLMAILGLKEILDNPKKLMKENKVAAIASFAFTGGMALLFAVAPTLFNNFLSAQEAAAFLPQAQGNPQVADILLSLEEARASIMVSDAWRSFFIILGGCVILFLYAKNILKSNVTIGILIVICLIDMWSVNKRYLNSENFVPKKRTENPFPKSPADEAILQDKDPNYRVFNLTRDPFNDATTSYYHKSIGGYHPAKLRNYQDLIEHQLSKNNMSIINMLNTKYFIVQGENGQPEAQLNPGAMGNAWFVNQIKWVNNANEEMSEMDHFNPAETAIIDKRYEKLVPNSGQIRKDSTDHVKLISFAPNALTYSVKNTGGKGFIVFSEVYYDGWKATIDGKEVPIIRTDYILRGLEVPEGEYEIKFDFHPTSITVTETIAYVSLSILIIILLFVGYKEFK